MKNTMFTLMYFATLLFVTSIACADVVEFENEERPLWFSAVGGPESVTTIGFTEYPNGTTISDQYSDLGVTFQGLNFVSGPFPVNYHDSWGLRIFGTDTPGNDLYFSEPINWIAADILGSMKIELYIGETKFYTSSRLGIAGNNQFGGLVSSQPFDHVRIYDMSDPLTVVDDLHFGPPVAVPAPGPIALAPFVLLLRQRRQRRRN